MESNRTSKRDDRKRRVSILKEVQSELNTLSKTLEDNAGERCVFSKACQGSLETLRGVDRKLRDLLKCPYWTPDDMESCYGCNLKLQKKLQEREDAAIKLKNLRDEWYAQQKHLRKFNTKLKEVEERQKLQSVRCTRHGLVFSRLLWKLSGLPFMIEYITANCERDLKEVMILMENCIYAFMKSFGTEVSDLKCEEYQYILALCGILTNISSVPDGRHFLMTTPVCHDVFDAIIKYLPQISTCELQILKWLMLVSIYNISSNPLGLKYSMTHKGITKVLNDCLEPYNNLQIIDITIHIIKRLVEDIHGPKRLRHIFMNYPIERIVEIGKTQEVPGASEPAGFIVMSIGKAFEKYGEMAELDMSPHRSPFDKFPTNTPSSCPSKSNFITEPEVRRRIPSIEPEIKSRSPRSRVSKTPKTTGTCIKVKPKPRKPPQPSTTCVSSSTSVSKKSADTQAQSTCISTTTLPNYMKSLICTTIKSRITAELDLSQSKDEMVVSKESIQAGKSAVETLYTIPDQSNFPSLSADIKGFLDCCGPIESPCRSIVPLSQSLPLPLKEMAAKKSMSIKTTKKQSRTKSDKSFSSSGLREQKFGSINLPEIFSQTFQIPSENPSEKKYKVVKKFKMAQEVESNVYQTKDESEDTEVTTQEDNIPFHPGSLHSPYVLQEHFGQEEQCRKCETDHSEASTPSEAASKLITALLSKLDLQQSKSQKCIAFKEQSKKALSLRCLDKETDPKSLTEAIEYASKIVLDILSKLDLDRYLSSSNVDSKIPWKEEDKKLQASASNPMTHKDINEIKRVINDATTANPSKSSQCSIKRVSFSNKSIS